MRKLLLLVLRYRYERDTVMLVKAIAGAVIPTRTMEKDDPDSGGEPTVFAECAECGNIYPAQEPETDTYRPVGTGGTCECGSDDFTRAISNTKTTRIDGSESP